MEPLAFDSDTIDESLAAAAALAYAELADQGYDPDRVHEMQVCHRASTILVRHAVMMGYPAAVDTRGGWTVTEHSYVSVQDAANLERIADLTWQQFLEPVQRHQHLPKVLIGSRSDVAAQARSFGVDDATAELWTAQNTGPNATERRQANIVARDSAQRAADSGAWQRFMSEWH